MDALGYQIAQGIIHKAMPRHPVKAGKARAHDGDGQMAAFAGACMPGMGGAVVAHVQGFWLE
jgi:hypothetical protein